MKKILTIVDVQNDFLPGGSLAVENADKVIPNINRLLDKAYDIVISTQDFHPVDHISFADTHGKKIGEEIEISGIKYHLWPKHCVANTRGADIASDLKLGDKVIRTYKGKDKDKECYSGFSEEHKKIINTLKQENEKAIFDIVGIATDYCVYATAKEMSEYVAKHNMKENITINVIKEAAAAIDEKNVCSLYKLIPEVNLI